MATTNFSQSVAGALDTAIPFASINNLATGGYAIGAAIDNRPTLGTTISYDLADLRIPITSATPIAGGYLTVSILPSIDGTNYASPNAASAAAPSLAVKTYQAANVATTEIVITDIPIGPYLFKVHVQNNLGVPISATQSAAGNAQLQRRTMANW
jgi:hypothetical protein